MSNPNLKQDVFSTKEQTSYIYDDPFYKVLEDFEFSKNMCNQKAMLNLIRFIPDKNHLDKKFYCGRETFMALYECGKTWASILTGRLVKEGLVLKVIHFDKDKMEKRVDYHLTEKSKKIIRQAQNMLLQAARNISRPQSWPSCFSANPEGEPKTNPSSNFSSGSPEEKVKPSVDMYVPDVKPPITYTETQENIYAFSEVIADEIVFPKLVGFKPYKAIMRTINKAIKDHGYEKCVEFFDNSYFPIGHKWKKGSTPKKITWGLKNFDKLKAEKLAKEF